MDKPRLVDAIFQMWPGLTGHLLDHNAPESSGGPISASIDDGQVIRLFLAIVPFSELSPSQLAHPRVGVAAVPWRATSLFHPSFDRGPSGQISAPACPPAAPGSEGGGAPAGPARQPSVGSADYSHRCERSSAPRPTSRWPDLFSCC